MMSQFRGRGPQNTISLIRGNTENLDTGRGYGPKKGQKFGHQLWMFSRYFTQKSTCKVMTL